MAVKNFRFYNSNLENRKMAVFCDDAEFAFSPLTLLVGHQKERSACNN